MGCRDIDILVLRHWDKVAIMSRHWGHCWNRCSDIAVNVASLRRRFLLSSRKLFTCFPHFISAISVHAREYKSINIEKKISIQA